MAIAPGDAGEAVRQLQHRLGAAGYLPDAGVTPDLYCSGTQQGVRSFQEDRGLTVSGVCDDDTWTALLEAWGAAILNYLGRLVSGWAGSFCR